MEREGKVAGDDNNHRGVRVPGAASGSLRQRWWRGRTRGAPQTGPFHESPRRTRPRPPSPQDPGHPPCLRRRDARRERSQGKSEPRVASSTFDVPPPQLPRFCQGKCSVNFTGWDSPRGSLAPTSLVPLTPEMPLGVVTITESLFGVTAAAPHVPRGNYSPPSPGLLSGRSVLHCLSPVQRGCYPLPGAEGGFLRLPNLQECK